MGRPGSERDKISLYGDLELRNGLFQQNHARDCHEIEDLSSTCFEEADPARHARSDELSMQHEESINCESNDGSDSGVTERSEFLVRCNRILRS